MKNGGETNVKKMKEKTLYLSEQENEILNKKCNKLGLSKSEYIRH